MKKILTGITALTLLIVAGGWFYFASSNRYEGHVDAFKLKAAIQTYAAGLKGQGLPVPASVSVKELITRGLLTEADVSGFAGIEVTVSLSPDDEIGVQDVWVRARLPDGHELAVLGDGSVQDSRSSRWRGPNATNWPF